MTNKLLIAVPVTLCLLGAADVVIARTELIVQPATVNCQIAAVLHENLDDIVRRYLKVVRQAKSIDDLQDFLPAFRMKKFRTEYSSKQKADWLRYRKQMPRIGELISKDVRKEKAVLLYETSEQSSLPNRKKQKTMADITLIKEDGKWKIFLEHFGPAKGKFSHKAAAGNE